MKFRDVAFVFILHCLETAQGKGNDFDLCALIVHGL
jgi:hypothetical protein